MGTYGIPFTYILQKVTKIKLAENLLLEKVILPLFLIFVGHGYFLHARVGMMDYNLFFTNCI